MNRLDIQQDVKDALNWEVSGDTLFTARLNRFIDRAYKRVAKDCPEALIPDEVRRTTPASYVSGSGAAITSFISSTTDLFVMEFSNSNLSSFTPRTDGTWDGSYWLEITLSTGVMVRYQCREFWTVVDIGIGANRKYVSLDRPWAYGAVSNLSYRLHVPYLWFRDDYESILIGQRFGSSGNPIQTEAISSAIFHDEWSNQNSRQYGYPNRLRRENHYQHPSPNIAPLVASTQEQGNFSPEPYGIFDYCFTYIWGYQDDARKSPSGNFIPLFESSPSPTSSAITIAGLGAVVTVTTPEIAWELNYGDNTTLRYGKSGWKKRLYRRRTSVTGGTHTTIEYPYVFQFLADIEDTATSYIDNGSVIPDYTLRLPEIHGYYGWSMWPLAQNELAIEYQLRCHRRPDGLLNDYDAPRIIPACMDALIFYAIAYCARHDKDAETAELFENKAKAILDGYRQMAANPTGQVQREGFDATQTPRRGWPRASLS